VSDRGGGVSDLGSDPVVAVALRLEARALRRGAPELRVVRTGMGPQRARLAARRLAADAAPAVAVAGLCGALDPALAPGDIVVASELRGAAGGPVPLETATLCRELERLGLSACVGPLRSVARVVRGRAERERLAVRGAVAVDMESAWLAAAAGPRPLAVLRVVLDAPDHELLRPTTPRNLLIALSRLRRAAPALAAWASLRVPHFAGAASSAAAPHPRGSS
jgi:4-hydroxy-3-methylbut-2-enyl diphosphate reductase